MKPYAGPATARRSSPATVGLEEHVRACSATGDGVATRGKLKVDRFPGSAEEFRAFFKDRFYGPTIAVFKANADDPERCAALDRDLVDLARSAGLGDNGGDMEWEYLLVTAQRA